MNRILRQVGVTDRPRIVGSPAELAPDPELVALLEDAAAQGYDRGWEAGMREGRAAAASRVPAAVAEAFDRGVRALAAQQETNAAGVVALALEIARRVLEREPTDQTTLLADRIARALAALDDTPLTIWAHPSDLEATAAGVADRDGVSVSPDPGLRPGEARITGPWSRADLTREAALAAIADALLEAHPAPDAPASHGTQ